MENQSSLPDKKRLVEAALFLSAEPLRIEDLSRLTMSTVEETRLALNELSAELEERKSALEVKEDASHFRFAVKSEFDSFAKGFSTIPELGKSVLKTLAFISYKQPVRQSEVIRFRSNKAYEHVKTLVEKGFIRREEVGRTYIIYTTKKFLEYFGAPSKNAPIQGNG
ncbi:MAG: SMC-Scp complex subunit ScpB [Candidatus Diapherotrites archaeon]|nr:SMC-Scp complex subunit ScpB [Candidatus Diapherotrites archaeon]